MYKSRKLSLYLAELIRSNYNLLLQLLSNSRYIPRHFYNDPLFYATMCIRVMAL